jgi:hypothetical protein
MGIGGFKISANSQVALAPLGTQMKRGIGVAFWGPRQVARSWHGVTIR